MNNCFRMISFTAGLLLAAGAVPNVLAAERSVEPERCVQVSRIKSTEILSNRQIVFEMLGGDYFVNTLPYTCPGLRRDAALLYRTSLDRLCNVDVITVLDSGGAGYFPGASCGLGKFEPVDKGEVAELRARARKK